MKRNSIKQFVELDKMQTSVLTSDHNPTNMTQMSPTNAQHVIYRC